MLLVATPVWAAFFGVAAVVLVGIVIALVKRGSSQEEGAEGAEPGE